VGGYALKMLMISFVMIAIKIVYLIDKLTSQLSSTIRVPSFTKA